MPDATSLYHCLKNKQLTINAFSSKDPAKGVFNIMSHLGWMWLILAYD